MEVVYVIALTWWNMAQTRSICELGDSRACFGALHLPQSASFYTVLVPRTIAVHCCCDLPALNPWEMRCQVFKQRMKFLNHVDQTLNAYFFAWWILNIQKFSYQSNPTPKIFTYSVVLEETLLLFCLCLMILVRWQFSLGEWDAQTKLVLYDCLEELRSAFMVNE